MSGIFCSRPWRRCAVLISMKRYLLVSADVRQRLLEFLQRGPHVCIWPANVRSDVGLSAKKKRTTNGATGMPRTDRASVVMAECTWLTHVSDVVIAKSSCYFLPDTAMSTQDLQWLIARKNNSFLVKQKGLGRVFSREPGNLASIHSYKYSGIVNDKSVGIVPCKDGRGIVLTKKNFDSKPGDVRGRRQSKVIKGGARKVAGKVAAETTGNSYRADLRKGTYYFGRAHRLEPP